MKKEIDNHEGENEITTVRRFSWVKRGTSSVDSCVEVVSKNTSIEGTDVKIYSVCKGKSNSKDID